MPEANEVTKRQILLVDDHPILRKGIGMLVNQQSDMMICGEAENRSSALALVEKLRPDLVVADLSLRDDRGLELIKDLKVRMPELPTLVLSMHEESLYAERALRAGARGYIMKQEAAEKILEAIRCVSAGGMFFSPRIANGILAGISGRSEASTVRTPGLLTDRELELLLLIGKGYGSFQAAARLHISTKTVEAHRANIRRKLRLSSGCELLQYAIRVAQEEGAV